MVSDILHHFITLDDSFIIGEVGNMAQKKVIVISDIHLGYEFCDREALNNFLDDLEKDPEITDLVLLGDIVDMWRRDSSGVFLEGRETMDRISALSKRIEVHYVAGNHDYHVTDLVNKRPFFHYPFDFRKDLTINDGAHTYHFMHGYEFEYGDDPLMYLVMESLCRVMSDDVGTFQDDIWGIFTKSWTDIRFILTVIFFWQKKRSVNQTASMLQQGPSARLAVTKPDIDQQAYKEQGKRANEILIFGHTHRPFINEQENLVNSGSWVTNEDVHNTYVELKDGKPKLFVYGKGEITQRVNIPK